MQSLSLEKASSELLTVCRLAYERGYICGTEGNLSLRVDDHTVMTTPSGQCKGLLTESELLLTNLDGQALDHSFNRTRNDKKASTELKMHLAVYQKRDDVMAVVHAHPTTATAFTIAGKSLNRCITPESTLTLGHIGLAPYATPSTDEVPASISDLLSSTDTIMLAHHGALTFGATIFQAFFRLETLEHHAKSLLIAQMLGGENTLNESQVRKLFAVCSVYGMTPPAMGEELIKTGTR